MKCRASARSTISPHSTFDQRHCALQSSNMDTEDFASDNFTESDFTRKTPLYNRLFLEFFTLFAVLSIAANIILIFTILKFRKLRNQATNNIFLHLNVVQLVYLICAPLTMRVFVEFDLFTPVGMKVHCVLNEIEVIVFTSIGFLMILLVCDSHIKIYSEDKYEKFRNCHRFFIALIYVLIIVGSAVTTQFCLREINPYITIIFTTLLFLLIAIFAIVMNIVHKIKRRKLQISKNINNLGLAIVNIFILLWCPAVLLMILAIFGYGGPILVIVFTTLGFASPVFNLIYVFYCDNHFNIFLKKVLTCHCNDYQNDTLDEQSVTYNDVNSTVQI